MPVYQLTASFEVKRQGWLFTFVTPTEDEDFQPTPSEEGEKLQGKYWVLDYGNDCLLLGFGSYRNGRFQCLMLVNLDSNGNYEEQNKRCFQTKRNMCQDDMINVWKQDCKEFYVKDKRADEKLAKQSAATKSTA
ncbi:uncharacterized protein LOC142766941 [Rhipicephalus microplus]|uniref:uncharacterized protein LOC142766941 n=1 Tax=Rhipicephalus microplus TaxID=6941 RepID=UPI003F6A8CB4